MTAEQVIALADQKAREGGSVWTKGRTSIRCAGRCPIEIAADVAEGDYNAAIDTLQLPWDVYEPIIGAADGPRADMIMFEEKTRLRALMLATFDFGEAQGGQLVKLVINKCYGGFSLSTAAYEKLIEWGVPVRAYVEQERGPDGLYLPQPANDGEVIFDRELTPPEQDSFSALYWKYRDSKFSSRYWDGWTRETRKHPLVVRVVEELGEAANGPCAKLSVVEIPDDVEYTIEEYDGREWVAEVHQTWG